MKFVIRKSSPTSCLRELWGVNKHQEPNSNKTYELTEGGSSTLSSSRGGGGGWGGLQISSLTHPKRLLRPRFILNQFHAFFLLFKFLSSRSLFFLPLYHLQLPVSFLFFPQLLQSFPSLSLLYPPPVLLQHFIQLFSLFSSLFLRLQFNDHKKRVQKKCNGDKQNRMRMDFKKAHFMILAEPMFSWSSSLFHSCCILTKAFNINQILASQRISLLHNESKTWILYSSCSRNLILPLRRMISAESWFWYHDPSSPYSFTVSKHLFSS